MLFLFCSLCFSVLRSISDDFSYSSLYHLTQKQPVFATFYSNKCKFSQQFLPHFYESADFFPKIVFIAIDCDKYTQLCDKQAVVGTPTTYLYINSNFSQAIEFTYPRTRSSIIEFLEVNMGISSMNATKSETILNPYKIDSLINNSSCAVIFFRMPDIPHVHKMWKSYKEIITSFEDEDVEFGSYDCLLFQNCINYVRYVPLINIYKKGEFMTYVSSVDPNVLLDTINDVCGLHRQRNGMLKEEFVLTNQTKEQINVAIPFILNESNQTFISPFIDTQYEKFFDKIANKIHQSNDKLRTAQELINTIDYYIRDVWTSGKKIDELFAKRCILDYIRAKIINITE